MGSEEETEHLRLYKSIINTGADVVRDLVEPKLLKDCPNGFHEFLTKEKHNFYHQWKTKMPPCCECPAIGCNISKKGSMDPELFNKFYKYNSNKRGPTGHHQSQNGTLLQICICKYDQQTVDVDKLDLSDMHYLMVHFELFDDDQEKTKIKTIMQIRNKIMHSVRNDCYTMAELSIMWSNYTTAIVSLSRSERFVRRRVEGERSAVLSTDDIKKLKDNMLVVTNVSKEEDPMCSFKDFVQKNTALSEEIKNHVTSIGSDLVTKLARTERRSAQKSTKNTLCLKRKLQDTKISLTNHLDNTERNIRQSTKPIADTVTESAVEVKKLRSEVAELKRSDEKKKELLENLLGLVGKIAVHIRVPKDLVSSVEESEDSRLEACSDQNDISCSSKTQWTTKIEGMCLTQTEEDNIMRDLPISEDKNRSDENQNKNRTINILTKKKECIILDVEADHNIFENSELLRAELLSLVKRVLTAGEVDTETESAMYVTLSFESPLTSVQRRTFMEILHTTDKIEGTLLSQDQDVDCDQKRMDEVVEGPKIDTLPDTDIHGDKKGRDLSGNFLKEQRLAFLSDSLKELALKLVKTNMFEPVDNEIGQGFFPPYGHELCLNNDRCLVVLAEKLYSVEHFIHTSFRNKSTFIIYQDMDMANMAHNVSMLSILLRQIMLKQPYQCLFICIHGDYPSKKSNIFNAISMELDIIEHETDFSSMIWKAFHNLRIQRQQKGGTIDFHYYSSLKEKVMVKPASSKTDPDSMKPYISKVSLISEVKSTQDKMKLTYPYSKRSHKPEMSLISADEATQNKMKLKSPDSMKPYIFTMSLMPEDKPTEDKMKLTDSYRTIPHEPEMSLISADKK